MEQSSLVDLLMVDDFVVLPAIVDWVKLAAVMVIVAMEITIVNFTLEIQPIAQESK